MQFIVPENTLNAITQTLIKLPYGEVAGLMAMISQTIVPMQQPAPFAPPAPPADPAPAAPPADAIDASGDE